MSIKKLFLISFTVTIMLQLACTESGIEQIITEIEYLGLNDTFLGKYTNVGLLYTLKFVW